jgi:hypothetical protein
MWRPVAASRFRQCDVCRVCPDVGHCHGASAAHRLHREGYASCLRPECIALWCALFSSSIHAHAEQQEAPTLDLAKMVSDLKKERDRLTSAIEALTGSYSPRQAKKTKVSARGMATKGKKRGGLTLEGRRRLSLAMKKRWAVRKRMGKKQLA